MEPENKKSDAEEILSEFQKTHGIEPAEEPQVESEPQVETESNMCIKHILSLSWVEKQLCHMLLQL